MKHSTLIVTFRPRSSPTLKRFEVDLAHDICMFGANSRGNASSSDRPGKAFCLANPSLLAAPSSAPAYRPDIAVRYSQG